MPFFAKAPGLVLAGLVALPSVALAESLPELVPPVAIGSTDVVYPPGGQGDASVILDLVVEKDGTVSDATVVEGAATFDEQARRAVLTWHFEPARRGDTAVRARIRARVTFHQEEPTAPVATPAAPRAGPSALPPPAPADSPEEPALVTVKGVRRELGETTLSSREVRELPGAFGDPFRAIEVLPGVIPVVGGVPYFFIRGAPPTENGYFIDGIRVPLLFHLGIGTGVLHPGLIDRVDLYPGAAPARHGRFAGAIVSAETREPAATAHGQANLRLFDAGALLETPFANGRGTALVAGRYGYPGPIVGAFSDTALSYWDYQARATWQLFSRDRVSVFAFGSHDRLASGTPSREQLVADFHRVDLRWDHAMGDGNVRIAVTLGHDSQGSYPVYVQDRSGAVGVEFERALSDSVRLRAGGDAHLDTYGFQLREVSDAEPFTPSSAFPPPTDVTTGAYADVVWQVSPRVRLVPGTRVDVFASSRDDGPAGSRTHTVVPAVDPRFAAHVMLSPSVAWVSAVGLSHQYPTLRVGDMPAPVASVPGFRTGSGKLQTVAQMSHGVELALPEDLTLGVTGFLSRWSGLTDLTMACFELDPPTFVPSPGGPPPPRLNIVCPDEAPVTARAYGLELLVRRALTRRLSGWISYTLSRSTRETHFATFTSTTAAATVPSEGDRTHVLNAVASYDLGRHWRFGSRFVWLSGTPYSDYSGSAPLAPYNNHRASPFFRLDVRLEKRWLLGGDRSIAFVFEGQNVTLSKETTAFGMDCAGEMTPQAGTTRCKPATIGPITIPSVGVEAFF